VQRAVQHRRQYDPATAQAELLAAIAEAPDDASSAEAYGALGDLALAAGDGAAARSAYAKVPSAELSLRLRVLRARALAGDVDGALAELDAFTGDATERIHVGLAKTRVLRHAGRIDEAHAIIKVLARDVHSKYLFHTTQHAFDLSMLDRLEVILELCTVDTELRNPVSCDSDLAKSLHETAPIRLRLLEQRLRDIRAHEREYLLIAELERYAKLLDAIRAPPELAAGHRWELARHPATLARRRREFALAARTGFVAAGKTAELAEIDELLGTP
jgi:hypothetical protein